jgi:hypothetical protein
MRKTFKSHPDDAVFLDPKHGNFKPRPVRQADLTPQPGAVSS